MFGVFRWFLRKTFCTNPQCQHRTTNMPLDEHLGRWILCLRHSVYEYTRTSKWLYKTTVENSYPTTIRLGRHTSRRNVFVEESKSDIPDHSHHCLVTTQDGLVFPLTEYSVFRPPLPPAMQENITAERGRLKTKNYSLLLPR